jgi:hypothetical protein
MDKSLRDLRILKGLAETMEPYLLAEATFWPLGGANMPQLSLGQYLLTERKLSDVAEAAPARASAEAALNQWRSAAERKAGVELKTRAGVWRDRVRDLREGAGLSRYDVDVAQRVMAQLLLERFPALERSEHAASLRASDAALRGAFVSGAFVWEAGLEPHFPPDSFWFLYGQPQPA